MRNDSNRSLTGPNGYLTGRRDALQPIFTGVLTGLTGPAPQGGGARFIRVHRSPKLRWKCNTGVFALLLLLVGCATPDLRLVSKPSMQFGEARGYMTALRLAPQHEPGRLPGGAQASVCVYCR